MSDQKQPEMSPLERALIDLVPTRPTINRDRLMYEAGRRAARKNRPYAWMWPSIAASLALVVAGQAIAWLGGRSDRIVERGTVIPEVRVSRPMASEPVVILTRRETPATMRQETIFRRTIADEFEERSKRPLLSAVTSVSPLNDDPVELLKPLHGRQGDLLSLPGGPL